jgi:hypothetical protein
MQAVRRATVAATRPTVWHPRSPACPPATRRGNVKRRPAHSLGVSNLQPVTLEALLREHPAVAAALALLLVALALVALLLWWAARQEDAETVLPSRR